MGWAKGSDIFCTVWSEVREHIPEDKREEVVGKIIDVFEDNDCDIMYECTSTEWPEVAFHIYQQEPSFFDDVVHDWHEADTDTPIHEYLEITEEQYARLVEKRT